MERMRKYSESEIHFSLMAVTKDRIETLQEQLDEFSGLLMSLGDEDQEQRREFESQISVLQYEYEQEKSKRARWKVSPGNIINNVPLKLMADICCKS
jgi:ubiquitin carboxyl-terminal hydrolase L5